MCTYCCTQLETSLLTNARLTVTRRPIIRQAEDHQPCVPSKLPWPHAHDRQSQPNKHIYRLPASASFVMCMPYLHAAALRLHLCSTLSIHIRTVLAVGKAPPFKHPAIRSQARLDSLAAPRHLKLQSSHSIMHARMHICAILHSCAVRPIPTRRKGPLPPSQTEREQAAVRR